MVRYLAFACVYVIELNHKGSLSALAVSFSAIPCLFLLIVSIIVYQTKKYKIVAPSLRDVRFSLVRSVVGLGGQFFVVMFSMLFYLFNLLISFCQECKAQKQLRNIILLISILMYLTWLQILFLTPFWFSIYWCLY